MYGNSSDNFFIASIYVAGRVSFLNIALEDAVASWTVKTSGEPSLIVRKGQKSTPSSYLLTFIVALTG